MRRHKINSSEPLAGFQPAPCSGKLLSNNHKCNLDIGRTSSSKLVARSYFCFLIFILTTTMSYAQEKIFIYPATEKVTHDGFDKEPPFIEYFKANADSANGSAILVCPGGGYGHLADQHEGADIAKFYNQYGFDAFVLHYRLNNGAQQGHRYPAQYNDVTTAMRLIKSRAKEWKLDPEKIGIIGFSAGGHLASTGGTMIKAANKKSKIILEQWSSRPSFMMLIYPVISLSSKYAHRGSAENLLGKNPDFSLLDSLSTQNRVSAQTPPTFLVHSTDDNAVPPENSVMFYEALRKESIPSSLHIYDHGGHGYGMAPKDKVLNTWPLLSIKWLERQGYRIKNK